MKKRKIGDTDLYLTTVGLGTWAIGGPWQFGWGKQDDRDSIKAILEAMEEGINWIDTAPIYGCGHAEQVVGKALKDISEKPLIATKCGLLWNEKREKVSCLKDESVKRECEDSLRRLGVERIDLMQVHWPEPEVDLEDGWGAIADLVKEGKVRYAGVSNFSIEQIKLCRAIHPVASVQPCYNMLVRQIEKELIGYCRQNDIGIVAYSPMARGLLTGKFSKDRLDNLAKDDNRRLSTIFREPSFSATLALVEELRPIAEKYAATIAQLAIAWVLRRAEITSAIAGARRAGQIAETAKAGELQLESEDIALIEELLEKRQDALDTC
ncbi:MAG: aldo/keto reductase [Planctomycetota bacterium]